MQRNMVGRKERKWKVGSRAIAGTLIAGGVLWCATGAGADTRTSGNTSALPVPDSSLSLPDERLVTMTFKDAPITEVIGMLADYTGLNIVVAGDVVGNLSKLSFKDTPPETVLQRIVAVAGLQYRKFSDGSYIVAKLLPPEATPDVNAANGKFAPFLGDPITGGVAPLPRVEDVPRLDGPKVNGTSQNAGSRRVSIRLRYVSPGLLAYQLDREHHPKPLEMQMSDDNEARGRRRQERRGSVAVDPNDLDRSSGTRFNNPYAGNGAADGNLGQFGTPYTETNSQFGRQGNQGNQGNQGGNNNRNGGGNNNGGGNGNGGGGSFDLPPGVESLVAIDPQNLVLVQIQDTPAGNAGLEELRRLIAELDRPLQQVEIEAQFVTLTQTAQRNLGLGFNSSNGNFGVSFLGTGATVSGGFTLNYARRNFQAVLAGLESQGRAKTVQAPRVLAINNLTAEISATRSFPIILSTAIAGGNIGGGGNAVGENLVYITTTIGLQVRPTINNDGTVTVVLAPTIETPTLSGQGQAPQVDTSFIRTVAIVGDGDTIALGGLRQKTIQNQENSLPFLRDIPILGRLFRSTTKQVFDGDLIIFLTARVVRRFVDDTPVTGADIQVPIGG